MPKVVRPRTRRPGATVKGSNGTGRPAARARSRGTIGTRASGARLLKESDRQMLVESLPIAPENMVVDDRGRTWDRFELARKYRVESAPRR